MSHVEDLFGAVFADPANDGPRQVLADALQEQGEPRGEFISLQLQSPRSQRSERRMAKLLDRHRTAFLRRLQPAVMPDGTQKWERGFLTEGAVLLQGDLVDVPDWATLKRLEVIFNGVPPRELASPHFRSLQEVSLAPLEAVPVLFDADHPMKVEAITLQGPPELSAWPLRGVESISRARSLPALTRLTLRSHAPDFADADWLQRMPVAAQLKSLKFAGSFRGVPLEAVAGALRHAHEAPANVIFHAAGIELRFKRDDGFRSLVVDLDPLSGVFFLDSMLRSIPPDAFDEITIASSQPLAVAQVATLKRAVKRLQLRNVSLPQSTRARTK